MKTKRFFLFGLPAVLLAVGLAVCDTGGGDPALGDNDPDPLQFSLSGSFGEGGQIKLQSGGTSLPASIMRSITADSYPLEGTLEYGEELVRLRGNYDPNTGNWSVSARYTTDDDIDTVFTFDGAGGYAGVPLRTAGATVMVPAEEGEEGDPEWALAFFPVEADDWSPTGNANAGVTKGGMPPDMHGYWSAAWDMPILADGDIIHMTMQCLISDWKITATGRRTYTREDRVIKQNQNILSIEEAEGGAIDVISCYLEYQEDATNLKAALTDWLGLPENGIAVLESIGDEKPDGPWIVDAAFAPYPQTGGFNPDQWEEVQSFYAAGGWEAWAASHDEWADAHINGPNTYFLKYRIQLVGDTLNMTKIVWGDDQYAGTYNFTSLESLDQNATHLEYQWVLLPDNTTYEKQEVLTVPYTR
jgi:hypothetical protein